MDKNKITSIIVLILFLILVFWSFSQKSNIPVENTKETESIDSSAISITTEDLTEENFIGKKTTITGSGLIVSLAQKYIDEEFSQFKVDADEQVPQMRLDFGAASPTANYSLDIEAEYLESALTHSIILSEYRYTGGANGMSIYKVFTSPASEDKLISLKDFIQTNMQDSFLALVKEKLLAWRPYDTEGPVIFEEVLADLTLDSFSNWSTDKENLNIYFSKYEIGAGALGAIVFPIPLNELSEYLVKI